MPDYTSRHDGQTIDQGIDAALIVQTEFNAHKTDALAHSAQFNNANNQAIGAATTAVQAHNAATDNHTDIRSSLGNESLARAEGDATNHAHIVQLQARLTTQEQKTEIGDVVGTKAQLDAYDITPLLVGFQIEVVQDETLTGESEDWSSIYVLDNKAPKTWTLKRSYPRGGVSQEQLDTIVEDQAALNETFAVKDGTLQDKLNAQMVGGYKPVDKTDGPSTSYPAIPVVDINQAIYLGKTIKFDKGSIGFQPEIKSDDGVMKLKDSNTGLSVYGEILTTVNYYKMPIISVPTLYMASPGSINFMALPGAEAYIYRTGMVYNFNIYLWVSVETISDMSQRVEITVQDLQVEALSSFGQIKKLQGLSLPVGEIVIGCTYDNNIRGFAFPISTNTDIGQKYLTYQDVLPNNGNELRIEFSGTVMTQ